MQIPEYFTAQEVADILKLSRSTITRLFERRKGVLVIGRVEGMRKRRYRTLRIPREALDRFILEKRVN